MIFGILRDIPNSNRLFGLAGLIPFWSLSFIIIFTKDPINSYALRALIAYGAIIISFLGGIHWGIAVQSIEKATWSRMGWGVILSLLGWCAIFIPYLYALALLITTMFVALVIDLKLVDNDNKRTWYRTLRIILSLGAITALLFTYLFFILVK
tara:strand:- start:739 stop:1197 length:459 start_codon:yes stop_codon:yes gene_type:complete